MLTRRTLCSAVALTAAIATSQAPALAQLKPNPVSCPKGPTETEDQWIRRCAAEEQQLNAADAARRSGAMNQQIQATARQRAALEKQPPLPAARNRLLGRWKSSDSSGGGGNDPFAQLAALTKGCNVLIGDGILEFQPARMSMYESSGRTDMGAVEYRGGTKGEVYVLPAKGGLFELLPFEFQTPDRIHLIGVTCTLIRTTAAVPAGAVSTGAAPNGRATPATPPPASRAGGAKPAPAAAAAPAPAAPRSGLLMLSDRIGYQCADGVQLAVERCFAEGPEADCQVIRVDLLPTNSREISFIETRAALTKRVASCTQRSLVIEKGLLKVAP